MRSILSLTLLLSLTGLSDAQVACTVPQVNYGTLYYESGGIASAGDHVTGGTVLELTCDSGFTFGELSENYTICAGQNRFLPPVKMCRATYDMISGRCNNGFHCNNGGCIPNEFKCDGDNDCDDDSDEVGCPQSSSSSGLCMEDEFECSNEICIPSLYHCDGINDCGDSSDELSCSGVRHNCGSGYFTCSNGHCIPEASECDLYDDCGDNSDEMDCLTNYVYYNGDDACPGFKCRDGDCINSSWVCDNDLDCYDGSDEENCESGLVGFANKNGKFPILQNGFLLKQQPVCLGHTCSNGDCIRIPFVCDGENDCDDGSDEQDCFNDGAGGDGDGNPIGQSGNGNGQGNGNGNGNGQGNGNGNGNGQGGNAPGNGQGPAVGLGNGNSQGNGQGNGNPPGPDNGNVPGSYGQVDAEPPTDGYMGYMGGYGSYGGYLGGYYYYEDNNPSPSPSHPLPAPPKPDPPTPPSNSNDMCGVSMLRRIYGGTLAGKGEYPWLAKLYIKFRGMEKMFECGGALVSNDWILTAAHCVANDTTGQPVEYVKGLLGRYDLSEPRENGVEVRSTQIFKHPSYSPNHLWNYDVALIKLSSSVAYNSRIRGVCLPDNLCQNGNVSASASTVDSCTNVIVAGWGQTKTEDSPDIMRAAELTLTPRQTCDAAFGETMTNQQLCVGDGSPSSCQGDSGGPLICKSDGKMHVIGIVSWGSAECGIEGIPSIYSRVCAVTQWIRQTMG